MTESEKNSYEKLVTKILDIKYLAVAFFLFVLVWSAIKFGGDILSFISRVDGYSLEERASVQSQLLPIYFGPNSVEINEESLERLKNYLPLIVDSNPKSILIEGHSRENTPTYNMALSEKRALTVKNYLIEHGVTATEIKSIGMGALYPLPSKEPNSRYQSRVQIKLSW